MARLEQLVRVAHPVIDASDSERSLRTLADAITQIQNNMVRVVGEISVLTQRIEQLEASRRQGH